MWVHRQLSSNKAFSLDNQICMNMKYHANGARVYGYIYSFIYSKKFIAKEDRSYQPLRKLIKYML